MQAPPGVRPSSSGPVRRRRLAGLLLGLAIVALAVAAGRAPTASAGPTHAAPSLGASGVPGTSRSDSYGLCPSAGPVYFGVEWNCIAELNLTLVLLILVSVGIIAYIYRDSDAAELPGESAIVPLSEGEWEAVLERRKARMESGGTDPPEGR